MVLFADLGDGVCESEHLVGAGWFDLPQPDDARIVRA
jgi:hypothetical protein